MHFSARCLATDPATTAVSGGDTTIERRGDLPCDEGASGRDRVGPGFIQPRGFLGEESLLHLHTRETQSLRTASGEGMRVRLSEDHAGHTRLDEGFRARAGAAHVVTGLERHDGGRVTGSLPRLAQGMRFGVCGAGAPVHTLSESAPP